jgi:hypothetical protein
MKNSKVVNVQGSGMFKELYVFEVELDNGDIGKIYRKSNDSKLSVGQDISYTINDKGSIKIVTDYQKNNQSQSTPKQDNVQKFIVRQSSITRGIEFMNLMNLINPSKFTRKEIRQIILEEAEVFEKWVMRSDLQYKVDMIKKSFDAEVKNDDIPFSDLPF